MHTPSIPKTIDATAASVTDIRCVATGLLAVRIMSMSYSRSIIWLMPFDAATTKKPPKASMYNSFQFISLKPEAVKYVTTAEKTTSSVSRVFTN